MRTTPMLFLATVALISATAPAQATSRTINVDMTGFAFSPASITIHAGDTVKWIYAETVTGLPPGCESPVFQTPAAQCPGHSTTSIDKDRHAKPLWDSGVHRAKGFPFSVRFPRPGTFNYFCTVHGGPHANNPLTKMNGTVIVRP